jgi:hypothetical protein
VRRLALVAALVLGAVATAEAQIGREHFTTPDTALDAAHAPQQQAFLLLRDSTSSISAAGAKLMSDLSPSSSLAWMQARARGIVAACGQAVGPLANARAVTEQGDWPRTNQKKAQADLLKEMSAFAGDLTECQTRWTALAADTSTVAFRESAPYEMKKLQDKLEKFNRSAQTYLRYIGIKLPPKGTPAP